MVAWRLSTAGVLRLPGRLDRIRDSTHNENRRHAAGDPDPRPRPRLLDLFPPPCPVASLGWSRPFLLLPLLLSHHHRATAQFASLNARIGSRRGCQCRFWRGGGLRHGGGRSVLQVALEARRPSASWTGAALPVSWPAPHADRFQHGIDLRAHTAKRSRFLKENLRVDCAHRGPVEGKLASNKFVEDHAEAEDVGGRADGLGLAANLLRRHVRGRCPSRSRTA